MAKIRICKTEDVPRGELNQFIVEGNEILVINLDGRYYCLAARCTHAGAPLVEGSLSGDILICPWHYSHFRVTDGSVVQGPANKPLKSYQGTIKDDYLFVELQPE